MRAWFVLLRALAIAGAIASSTAGCGLALDLDPPDPVHSPLDAGGGIDASQVDAFVPVVPECEGDEDCDDERWCNGEERCEEGRCVDGEPACPPASACLRRVCDEASDVCGPYESTCAETELCSAEGVCVPSPECTGNADCPDDGDPCNGSIACASGRCIALPPPNCGGARGCVVGECVPFEGCRDVPLDERCEDDEVSCTRVQCELETGLCIQSPEDAACDDGVTCTEDRCAPGARGAEPSSGCQHVPHDERCTALVGSNSCARMVCVGEEAGTAEGCGLRLDSGLCLITQTCAHTPGDVTLGTCVRLPDSCEGDDECDDGDPCNGEDVCVAGRCVRASPSCPDAECQQGYCDLRGIVRACGLRATAQCFGTATAP